MPTDWLSTELIHFHFSTFHFQVAVRFARQQDPLPYMVSQPLPWQVHSVSHSRRSSKADEVSYNEICTSVVVSVTLLSCQDNWILQSGHDWVIHCNHILSSEHWGLLWVTFFFFFFFTEKELSKCVSSVRVAGVFTHKLAFLIFFYLKVRLSMWNIQQSTLTQHVSIHLKLCHMSCICC